MSRPTLEVADIVREWATDSGNSTSHILHGRIARCSMPSSGAALRHWAVIVISASAAAIRPSHINSCRNRHCPKCQGNVRAKWLAARSAELLPVPYFHVVFTLPHELSALVLQNKRLLYDLLFRTSAASLLELARDPKHLGADIGFLGVLHTWGQNLQAHPHVHYIVPAGGLALDGSRWIDSSPRFFLPVQALSKVFCGKFCEELRELFKQDRLQFHSSHRATCLTWRIQPLSLATRPEGLGRLRQATLRRRRTCSQLPGPLHPSRRHLQPSPRGLRERSRLIPLARLCPRRQEEGYDRFCP